MSPFNCLGVWRAAPAASSRNDGRHHLGLSGRHCRNPHQRPDYAGWTFGVITLDPALLDDTVERVNITLPRHVVKRLDALTRAAGESRSGYIAHLTLEEHEA
ncbi:type II toxin-antitoxin system HicB family antitoxin [Acidisoma sp. S159]|uniref:type II toxin-antitoxin system HicB family antitoxin n=1 Tax=Acidisoma sp. S159 TaxID=1747225 RepID=UPI00131C5EBB